MPRMLIKSLLNTRAYPESTSSVHLLQTHVSFLFITDSFVYKIKKPVDFGFLNFTTLDRRRFYCDEEVRLNRRLCPDIYLGVVEVRESSAGITIDREGKIIDYAVKMKRLPEERMLHRLLIEGKVTDGDMRGIARTIAEFHLKAGRSEEIDGYGRIENIIRNWEENFQQLVGFIDVSLSKGDLQIIKNWVDEFIGQNRPLFDERVSTGFIRECDGDIHSENICLTDKICIFDCIEFNKRFRYCDTAADIAFLLMDLDYHGKSPFSTVLLDEYMTATGDRKLPALLDFYKIYRAVVRGKVESFRLIDPHITAEEKESARERARLYFRLARGYVLRRRLLPSLMITCGLMGSGKSTVASSLAFELGVDVVTADAVRKEIGRLPAGSHDFSGYGGGIYTPAFNAATYGELLDRSEKLLASGKSVIVDATFRRRSDRARFRSLAEKLRVPFFIILTSCPKKIMRERLEDRKNDPAAISDGRWELYQQQKNEFEPVEENEGKTITVDTSTSLLNNVDTILRHLELI